MKISASRDSADISYKNDNVDLVVKPNNKEQAKVVINSMKDNEVAAKREREPAKKESDQLRNTKYEHVSSESNEAENQQRSGVSTEDERSQSPRQKVHIDRSYSDIGMRRSKIKKHNDDNNGNEDRKEAEASDITWRGRINHSTEEQPPDNNHVLSALSEIKSLMTLSMKPPNLKAFDEVLPDSTDKYLTTADTVIKKLEHGQEKKRRAEGTQDNQYIHKVKDMIYENLRNNTYADDPADYGYVQKAHDIIEQEHLHKGCSGSHCRHNSKDRSRKSCSGAHCRHQMYLNKEEQSSNNDFEDEYAGKGKDHTGRDITNSDRNRYNEYDNNDGDFLTSHRKSHNQQPYEVSDFHNSHISPYHSHGDEAAYHALYGDDNHHNSQETSGFHGSHSAPHHDNPDAIFEKEFENKINEKEYNSNEADRFDGAHNLRHVHPHHMGGSFHHGDGDGGSNEHDNEHMGAYHPHGKDEFDLGIYHHGGELTELPEHHNANHHNYHNDDGEGDSHNREHDHSNYDFDEAKEIKDEEHDSPDMESLNGKLKDWYKLNALGTANGSTTMDEPAEGEIVVAQNENVKEENKPSENKTSNEDKKIESKFEKAGEKPLNSTEAEQAINKLNESLANGLNESTIKAISSLGNNANATDLNDLNKTAAAALNSFNTIKFESMNNDTLNAEKMLNDDDVESKNGTHFNKTRTTDGTSGFLNSTERNFTAKKLGHESDLKKKISNIEKKINSSGDLMKKLEDLEKKLNSSDQSIKHNGTINLKKHLTSTEKELLRVSPEDILQTQLASSDDLKILHNKDQKIKLEECRHNNCSLRSLNSSTTELDSEKNMTLNGTSSDMTNGNETGGIENIYASIGEPDEVSGETHRNISSTENKTNADVGGSGESAPSRALPEDKHAEQVCRNYLSEIFRSKIEWPQIYFIKILML